MSAPNDGGPAFPQSDLSGYGMGPSATNSGGMTLRDWFAGQALAGLLSCGHWHNSGVGFAEHIATKAGEIADAMLAARATGEAR